MSILHTVRRAVARPYGLPLGIDRIEFVQLAAAVALRDLKVRFGIYDDLSRLAVKYPTDKGLTFYPFHGYTANYSRLFANMRDQPVTLLEIGLARKRDRKNPRVICPSLQLWAEYFPKATILGFDIDDFSMVGQERTTIYRGDQGKPDDLTHILADHPQLDIVIDDGSHASYHQQVSLQTLWPALSPKGIYVIEDLDSQPLELEHALPKSRKTIDVLKDPQALMALIGLGAQVQCFDSPLRLGSDTMACISRRSY